MSDDRPRKPFLAEGRAQALAHRGDRAGRPPGNRVAAFSSAVELGLDHLETDVQLSADGELVIFHDDELDHETTGRGRVADHGWDELSRLRYVHDGTVLDEGLIRLADALDRWPDTYWNIDAKSADAVAPLLTLIEEAGAADRVLLTSFGYRNLRRLRRGSPDTTCTGLSQPEIIAARLASWLRLPFPRLGDAAQVPEHRAGVTVVDERFVATCHRAGIAVHVWTVNDRDDMSRLLDLGVDGIITDEPAILRDVLVERGSWPPRRPRP